MLPGVFIVGREPGWVCRLCNCSFGGDFLQSVDAIAVLVKGVHEMHCSGWCGWGTLVIGNRDKLWLGAELRYGLVGKGFARAVRIPEDFAFSPGPRSFSHLTIRLPYRQGPTTILPEKNSKDKVHGLARSTPPQTA